MQPTGSELITPGVYIRVQGTPTAALYILNVQPGIVGTSSRGPSKKPFVIRSKKIWHYVHKLAGRPMSSRMRNKNLRLLAKAARRAID